MSKNNRSFLILYVIVLVVLIVTSFFNFKFFHMSIAMITIFFGWFIFVLSINCRKYTNNILLLVIGVIYIYIGILTFLHALSYNGLDIIFNDTNISLQFGQSARLLEATSFFIIFTFLRNHKKVNYTAIHISLITYTTLSIFLISNNIIPVLYTTTGGASTFKIVMETIVISLYVLSLLGVSRSKKLTNQTRIIIYIIVVLKILSEISLAHYAQSSILLVTLGLIFKYLSYSGLYVIFISELLLNPKQKIYSLFQKNEEQLIVLSERDQLTKLYNHQTSFIKIEELINSTVEDKKKMFIAMVDLDDFKIVNDTYGHQVGDNILVRFSQLLLNLDCGQKIVGRYGGDEFLICGFDNDFNSRCSCFETAQKEMKREFIDIEIPITFSVGVAFYKDDATLKDLIYKADINLYKSKRNGKNNITL